MYGLVASNQSEIAVVHTCEGGQDEDDITEDGLMSNKRALTVSLKVCSRAPRACVSARGLM